MWMYQADAHYWHVAGDALRAWSSAEVKYVAADSETTTAWLERGGVPTRIASEAELRDVLAAAGCPERAPGYVPQSIYMWQAKTALAAIGKLSAIDAAIDASNNPALMVAWHTAPYISRTSEAVAAIGAMTGLDAKAIDALFIQAAAYKV
mgnify:CR=1 FL=1